MLLSRFTGVAIIITIGAIATIAATAGVAIAGGGNTWRNASLALPSPRPLCMGVEAIFFDLARTLSVTS
jgi:hypothetical protein